jgi:hypothetical protein
MSNNPFLNSGRFSSLDDTDNDTSSFVKKSKFRDSDTNKNKSYDSSSNSFIRRDRTNYNKPITNEIINEPNNTELFPDLIPNTNTTINTNTDTLSKPSTKYKDILKNVIVDDTPVKKVITPGWVEITKKGNNIVYEYGEPTFFMLKQQFEENLENDLNYQMNTIIQNMKKCWDRYEREYDEVNGEGAYEERFRLPPVYTEEYDTDSNEEETDDDDNDIKE